MKDIEGLHATLAGQVSALTSSEEWARMLATAIEGRMSVIEDYRDGDLFGEHGLFGQAVSAHDVTAVRLSHVGAFANPDFVGLMSSYGCVALAVSRSDP